MPADQIVVVCKHTITVTLHALTCTPKSSMSLRHQSAPKTAQHVSEDFPASHVWLLEGIQGFRSHLYQDWLLIQTLSVMVNYYISQPCSIIPSIQSTELQPKSSRFAVHPRKSLYALSLSLSLSVVLLCLFLVRFFRGRRAFLTLFHVFVTVAISWSSHVLSCSRVRRCIFRAFCCVSWRCCVWYPVARWYARVCSGGWDGVGGWGGVG